jgi:hypothetical protein
MKRTPSHHLTRARSFGRHTAPHLHQAVTCLREEQSIGEHNVGKDACADDNCALCNRSVLQQIWVVWGNLAVWVIIWEGHIASQRDCPQRILHFLPLSNIKQTIMKSAQHRESLKALQIVCSSVPCYLRELSECNKCAKVQGSTAKAQYLVAQQRRAKSYGEFCDMDALQSGCNKVPAFMYGHNCSQHADSFCSGSGPRQIKYPACMGAFHEKHAQSETTSQAVCCRCQHSCFTGRRRHATAAEITAHEPSLGSAASIRKDSWRHPKAHLEDQQMRQQCPATSAQRLACSSAARTPAASALASSQAVHEALHHQMKNFDACLGKSNRYFQLADLQERRMQL